MTSSTSRADRRRATEGRILDSARRLFAERGYERTTIRAVATAAQVDPGLVMQYFGSKRELFTQAVHTAVPLPAAGPADAAGGGEGGAPDVDTLLDRSLVALGLKLGGLPDSTLATLRSMLTDPSAAEHARELLGGQIASVSASLPAGEDTELRAALVTATILGVTIAHRLLDLPPLRDAPADRVATVLRPALKSLTGTGG